VGPDAKPFASAGSNEENLLIANLNSLNKIEKNLLSTQLADFRKVITK